MIRCPCVYFDPSDDDEETCACGHVIDEHECGPGSQCLVMIDGS